MGPPKLRPPRPALAGLFDAVAFQDDVLFWQRSRLSRVSFISLLATVPL